MFTIVEFEKWPFRVAIRDDEGELIIIKRTAWGSKDTLKTVRQRPLNIAQMIRLERLINLANFRLDELKEE